MSLEHYRRHHPYYHYGASALGAVGSHFARHFAGRAGHHAANYVADLGRRSADYLFRRPNSPPPTPRKGGASQRRMFGNPWRHVAHPKHPIHSSAGDTTGILYRRKKRSRAKVRYQKKFAAKIHKALDTTLPILRLVCQQPFGCNGGVNLQQWITIMWKDVVDFQQLTQAIQNAGLLSPETDLNYRVLNGHLEGFYSNAANTAVVMDWYRVIPKCDNVNSPYDDLSLGATITYGETSVAGSYSNQLLNTTVGTSPFLFRAFTEKWTILNKRRIILQPGETKEFVEHIKGFPFQTTRLTTGPQASVTNLKVLKGLTEGFLVAVYGQPVHDQADGTKIGSAPVRVDGYYTVTYNAQSVSSPVTTHQSSVQLSKAETFVAITTPRTVEEFNPSAPQTAGNTL